MQLLLCRCSEAASFLGGGQRVLSYTLFHMPENSRKGYKDRVGLRLGEMRKVYPGRVLRLYSNLPTRNPNLCTLLCVSSPDFFYCNVSNILGNLAVRSHGTAW